MKSNLAKAVASGAIGLAVIAGLFLTNNLNCLWALVLIPAVIQG